MTEDQIERICEKRMDELDFEYKNGFITEEVYHEEVRRLDRWAQEEYREISRENKRS